MLSPVPSTCEWLISDTYDSCSNSQGGLNISIRNFCSSVGAFYIHFCLLFLQSFQSISFVVLDCDHLYFSSFLWHFIFLATFARRRNWFTHCFLFDLPWDSAFLVLLFFQTIFLLFISSYPYFLPTCHFTLFPFILLSSFIYLFTQHILAEHFCSKRGALYIIFLGWHWDSICLCIKS